MLFCACLGTKSGVKSAKYKTVLPHVLGAHVLEEWSQTIMRYLRNTQNTVIPGYADMHPTQFWRILSEVLEEDLADALNTARIFVVVLVLLDRMHREIEHVLGRLIQIKG